MAAMMGAVLNAPLAALMAVLELTYSPGIIFPSMLIIVIACVVTRQLYKCDGIFVEQLNLIGTTLESGPLQQMLGNIGVRSAMKTAFIESPKTINLKTAKILLSNNPIWILIKTEEEQTLLRAADLAIALKLFEEDQKKITAETKPEENIDELNANKIYIHTFDLSEIPAQRLDLAPITELSSLFEAKKLLDKKLGSALYVTPQIQVTPEPKAIGIITQETISNYYM
jgi:CIC family chloride channel protein